MIFVNDTLYFIFNTDMYALCAHFAFLLDFFFFYLFYHLLITLSIHVLMSFLACTPD